MSNFLKLLNTKYQILNTKHASQKRALHLSRELYKSHLFLQNKANLKNDEMNLTTYITKDYEIFWPFTRRKNKAKQTQNKANLQNAKMNVTTLLTTEYEDLRLFSRRKNKPKQTQFKANSNPILDQNWLLFSEIGFVFPKIGFCFTDDDYKRPLLVCG